MIDPMGSKKSNDERSAAFDGVLSNRLTSENLSDLDINLSYS